MAMLVLEIEQGIKYLDLELLILFAWYPPTLRSAHREKTRDNRINCIGKRDDYRKRKRWGVEPPVRRKPNTIGV